MLIHHEPGGGGDDRRPEPWWRRWAETALAVLIGSVLVTFYLVAWELGGFVAGVAVLAAIVWLLLPRR